ncbi:YajG family lipoprotein [Alginatibacterium sediminis]|uniref:YajG family lipoprotein n=1 Tax=Alginatibacterium sediminis TaxID=2164068 RepID=UPI001314D26D|nr:YajG family lipoprotein [Alginatibacterium sediminis]
MARFFHPLVFALPISLLLAACAQPVPEHLDISPQVQVENSDISLAQTIAYQTQDLRSHRYIISVHQGEQELAQLVNLEHSLRSDIDQNMRAALQQYQIEFSEQSEIYLQLDILELSAKVKQHSLTHTVKSDMRIKVSVKTPKQTLAKQYQNSFEREGSMQVDLNKVESEMGQQLSTLLNRVVNDPEILKLLETQS